MFALRWGPFIVPHSREMTRTLMLYGITEPAIEL